MPDLYSAVTSVCSALTSVLMVVVPDTFDPRQHFIHWNKESIIAAGFMQRNYLLSHSQILLCCHICQACPSAGTPNTTRKNGKIKKNYCLLWLKTYSLLICLVCVLTLLYLDWPLISMISPCDAVIKWTEVINTVRIYGNEAPRKGKREKFRWVLNVWEEEKQTDALIFIRICHMLLLVLSVVSVLWYKYVSKEQVGNLVLVAVLCKRTVRVTLEISLILEKKKEKKG